MIERLATLIDFLYFHSKNGNNDSRRDFFDKYYMPLIEIKDFNTLIDNIPFFDQPVKTNKNYVKNLLKCQEIMTKQQDEYDLRCFVIKIIK